jgi:hypothetical protein
VLLSDLYGAIEHHSLVDACLDYLAYLQLEGNDGYRERKDVQGVVEAESVRHFRLATYGLLIHPLLS